MLQIKSIINEVSELRYIIDNLDIRSSIGRYLLLTSPFLTEKEAVEKEFNLVDEAINKLTNKHKINNLLIHFQQIHDITGTIRNLSSGHTLDEIELFELKHFALTAESIRIEIEKLQFSKKLSSSLSTIISILDPENSRIPSFYVYDCYSSQLAEARKMLKSAKTEDEKALLFDQVSSIELTIKEALSTQLFQYADLLLDIIHHIGVLDIAIAKARFAMEKHFVRPSISEDSTYYKNVFNPLVQEQLHEHNQKFQPVTISLPSGIQVITGANMTGKTVILKTLAACQYLAQFGFFVPATEASIVLVNKICMSLGDSKNTSGLSAFASEILKINEILKDAKTSNKLLVLIDELARTTNPTEGKAIVEATLSILNRSNVRGLISTHYSNIRTSSTKLRVKGLAQDIRGEITQNNLSNYIDYSVTIDSSDDSPQDALRIASLLNVESELIELAKDYLGKPNS